jgi:hypothetical protein
VLVLWECELHARDALKSKIVSFLTRDPEKS